MLEADIATVGRSAVVVGTVARCFLRCCRFRNLTLRCCGSSLFRSGGARALLCRLRLRRRGGGVLMRCGRVPASANDESEKRCQDERSNHRMPRLLGGPSSAHRQLKEPRPWFSACLARTTPTLRMSSGVRRLAMVSIITAFGFDCVAFAPV